jgi:hypothetical protein
MLRGGLAALLAAGHDGGVEVFSKPGGKLVDLVGPVDLDGLAGGVEDNFAVSAFVQMLLHFGAGFRGDGVVDQIVEKRDELSASHDSALASLGLASFVPFFLRK